MTLCTSFLFGQASYDVVSIGEKAPDFTVKTIEDKTLCLDELEGKYVLINFFATWCKPCMEEMPLIEKQIQQRFSDSELVVIAIGREHNINELNLFNQRKKFSFHIAADPERNIYNMYAQKFIPRLYLVDKTGKLIYAHSGYKKSEFDKLIKLIETSISK
jgi:peroxiredoxin